MKTLMRTLLMVVVAGCWCMGGCGPQGSSTEIRQSRQTSDPKAPNAESDEPGEGEWEMVSPGKMVVE